ncbi:MAG TPA: DUF2911 domain-containing protein [Vicinamibacterales bacterium]|nr:DUF2911 domain-containing protein [Vicinamibacterales bacterium]
MMLAIGAIVLVGLQAPQQAPKIKRSQHGSVSQQIADTRIRIEYDRPVARGRDLFGALVPYDKIWCPGANDCTTIEVSSDIEVDGRNLPAGTYTMWAKPGAEKWQIIFNRAHPTFHTQHARVADQDFLTLDITPRAGTHMETLTWYFPVVDGRHAELVLHWGTVVVPISIDVPE